MNLQTMNNCPTSRQEACLQMLGAHDQAIKDLGDGVEDCKKALGANEGKLQEIALDLKGLTVSNKTWGIILGFVAGIVAPSIWGLVIYALLSDYSRSLLSALLYFKFDI